MTGKQKIFFLFFVMTATLVVGLSHPIQDLENLFSPEKKTEKVKIKLKIEAPKPQPKVAKKVQTDLQPQNQPLMAQTFQGYLSGASSGRGLKSGAGESLGSSIEQAQNQNRKASVIGQPQMEYPSHAKSKGLKGYVVIQAQIDVTGEILNLAIIKSEPQGVFDQDVLKNVKTWKFQPEMNQGQLAKGLWTQKIRFDYD
jgi:TonB family protein